MAGNIGRLTLRQVPSMLDQISIYQINLDHRADRWSECQENHQRAGFLPGRVHRISACAVPEFGNLGCARSHIKALTSFFVDDSQDICMILEDDFDFVISAADLEARLKFVSDANIVWNAILLSSTGGNIFPTAVPGLSRVFESLSASGYIVRRSYLPKLLHCFIDAAANLHRFGGFSPRATYVSRFAIDVAWQALQRLDDWYILSPVVGHQRPSYSDIEGVHVDYSRMIAGQAAPG